MTTLKKAKEPFIFFTEIHIPELTGLKATNLQELLNYIKTVPGSVIYWHTHHFLQRHQYLSPEPPNDFAYWVYEILGEKALGEELFSIDTIQYSTIRELREEIIRTIENYITKYPISLQRFASAGEEFNFVKSVSFIFATPYKAYDLHEFLNGLKKITVDSIYFHMFEARLRIRQGINDFSVWLETSLSEERLANKIASLDPYTHTMENLRHALIRLVEKRITELQEKHPESL